MEPMLYVAAAVFVVFLLLALTFLRKSRSQDAEAVEEQVAQPRAAGRAREDGPAGAGRRPVRRRRMDRAQLQEDSDEEQDDLLDDIAMPEGKVGAKKLAKLQAKAEKRANREAELQEREERKKREDEREEQRRKEESRQEKIDKKQEEEEKKRKEEEEEREYEEYLKLKEAFTIDEEGTHEAELNQDAESLLTEFINYVKDMKVIMLEDLAAHFKIKTQDAIDRVTELLKEGQLQGVLDDRGKFIYITREELEAVAKFINQRGRVSITELAESSNKLINLSPDNKETLERLVGADTLKVSS